MFDVKHQAQRLEMQEPLWLSKGAGKMATIIALANQKGGVSKTTSTANLAYALVRRGKRVLAIDADPQASLTIYLGHQPFDLQDQERTLYYALVHNVPLESIVIPGNPSLLPSSIRLAKADRELMHAMRYSDSLLRGMLEGMASDYDYILIDCMPHLGILTSNALTAADLVLIPVRTEYLSIEGIPLILEEVEETRQRSNRKLRVLGILPTMYSRAYTQDQEALSALHAIAREQRITVFDPVPRSTEYDKATSQGAPTLVLAPRAPGVDTYYKLADAIIDHG
jgi:chromosome partitioning protein